VQSALSEMSALKADAFCLIDARGSCFLWYSWWYVWKI